MIYVDDAASLSSYGSVGRLLVVVVEGVSLKASDENGKRLAYMCGASSIVLTASVSRLTLLAPTVYWSLYFTQENCNSAHL